MASKISHIIQTTETVIFRLNGTDLISLLKANKPQLMKGAGVESITVKVPGGGDYSNTTLDVLNGETEITFTLKREKSETKAAR